MTDEARKVLDALGFTPRTSKDLQLITGLRDVIIRRAVRQLRLDGVKVCSGAEGFWLWNGEDDSWSHTKNQIKSRAAELMELYHAMEYCEDEGQVRFDV